MSLSNEFTMMVGKFEGHRLALIVMVTCTSYWAKMLMKIKVNNTTCIGPTIHFTSGLSYVTDSTYVYKR